MMAVMLILKLCFYDSSNVNRKIGINDNSDGVGSSRSIAEEHPPPSSSPPLAPPILPPSLPFLLPLPLFSHFLPPCLPSCRIKHKYHSQECCWLK